MTEAPKHSSENFSNKVRNFFVKLIRRVFGGGEVGSENSNIQVEEKPLRGWQAAKAKRAAIDRNMDQIVKADDAARARENENHLRDQ